MLCKVTSMRFFHAEKYFGRRYKYRPCSVSPFTNVHLKVDGEWQCFWRGFTSLVDKDGTCPEPTIGEFPPHE